MRCKICNRHADEVGLISWRGKCLDCGLRLFDEAVDDLHYHQGPVFDLWRRRLAASVGAELLDDDPSAA